MEELITFCSIQRDSCFSKPKHVLCTQKNHLLSVERLLNTGNMFRLMDRFQIIVLNKN